MYVQAIQMAQVAPVCLDKTQDMWLTACVQLRVRLLHTTMRKSNTEVTLVPEHAIKASDEGFSDQLHALGALYNGTNPWYQSMMMQGQLEPVLAQTETLPHRHNLANNIGGEV
jgi:hypothetical protein